MRITVHIRGADGVTSGYEVHVEALPRRGEEILLIDGAGEHTRHRVTNVRHLLFGTADYKAAQGIEVEAE